MDDALLEIGRYHLEVEGDPEQGARGLRAGRQALPAERRRARRLLLPGPADAGRGHHRRRARRRAGAVRARAAPLPAQRVGAAGAVRGGAGTSARRDACPRRWRPRAASRSNTPRSDAAPEAQFQVGHVLALMGEPRQAMEEFQQIRNRFPDSEWAPRALDRITALYRLYRRRASPSSRSTRPSRSAPATCSRTCARLLMTPVAHAVDRLRQGEDGRALRPRRQDGAGPRGVDLRSSPWAARRRGDDGALAVRMGPRDLRASASPATSRASRSRWRRSRRRCSRPEARC